MSATPESTLRRPANRNGSHPDRPRLMYEVATGNLPPFVPTSIETRVDPQPENREANEPEIKKVALNTQTAGLVGSDIHLAVVNRQYSVGERISTFGGNQGYRFRLRDNHGVLSEGVYFSLPVRPDNEPSYLFLSTNEDSAQQVLWTPRAASGSSIQIAGNISLEELVDRAGEALAPHALGLGHFPIYGGGSLQGSEDTSEPVRVGHIGNVFIDARSIGTDEGENRKHELVIQTPLDHVRVDGRFHVFPRDLSAVDIIPVVNNILIQTFSPSSIPAPIK